MKKKLLRFLEIVLFIFILFSFYKISAYYISNKNFEKDRMDFQKIVSSSVVKRTDNKWSKEDTDGQNESFFSSKQKEKDENQYDESYSLNSSQEEEIENPNDSTSLSKSIVQDLVEAYPNAVGRIKIEDTDIDFPIVQGKDNSYYLDHNFKNEYHPFGAIFMDADNNPLFSDNNTVLYGHNIRSGHIFHDLEKFTDPAFVNNHPYINIDSASGFKTYKIVAVYTTSPYEDYRKPNYYDQEWNAFLERINKQNILDKKLRGKDYNILTLSTCSDEDQRLVIHGIEQ